MREPCVQIASRKYARKKWEYLHNPRKKLTPASFDLNPFGCGHDPYYTTVCAWTFRHGGACTNDNIDTCILFTKEVLASDIDIFEIPDKVLWWRIHFLGWGNFKGQMASTIFTEKGGLFRNNGSQGYSTVSIQVLPPHLSYTLDFWQLKTQYSTYFHKPCLILSCSFNLSMT